MAFKMNGWSAGHGTGSALTKKSSPGVGTEKVKGKHGGSMEMGYDHSMKRQAAFHQELTWAEALKNDPNLSNLVKERDKYEKGTDEYAAAQNRVNKAYENAKRHNVKTETTSKTNPVTGRTKETTVVTTPGIGTETTITKKKKDDTITKQKVDNVPDDYYEDEDATRSKQKQGKDQEFGTEDDKKKKKKKFKDTKLGQFLTGKNKKKKDEEEEEDNKSPNPSNPMAKKGMYKKGMYKKHKY